MNAFLKIVKSYPLLTLLLMLRQYKKQIIITTSVIALQLIFGWDAKFCIINLIWLFV
jgi:hypothetical protein